MVVLYNAIFWPDGTNVRITISYSGSPPKYNELQRQSLPLNASRFDDPCCDGLLQNVVHMASCRCSDHALFCRDDFNPPRSVAKLLHIVLLIKFPLTVYALYNRNQRIALALVSLVVAEISVCAVNSYINIPKLQFDSACLTRLALRPVIQFGSVICPYFCMSQSNVVP
jgi:hypothetical protein